MTTKATRHSKGIVMNHAYITSVAAQLTPVASPHINDLTVSAVLAI